MNTISNRQHGQAPCRRRAQPTRSLSRNRRGFTLLEVLLVLGIIIVMLAMVVPNFLGSQQKALTEAAQVSIRGFEQAVKMYAIDHQGRYPEGTEADVVPLLMADVDENGKPRPPYLEQIPMDPWKQPLKYEYPPTGNRKPPGGKPAIWSIGPDGKDGTEDDITNWVIEGTNL